MNAYGWNRSAMIVSSLAAVLVLSGCQAQPGPEVAAKEWMQAFAAQDGLKLGQLTCAAEQQTLTNEGMLFAAVNVVASGALGGEKIRLGVDELTFQTIRSDATTANVRIAGQMRIALGIASQAQSVDFTVRMAKEQDRWRFCGTESSGARGSGQPPVQLGGGSVPAVAVATANPNRVPTNAPVPLAPTTAPTRPVAAPAPNAAPTRRVAPPAATAAPAKPKSAPAPTT